MAVRRPARPPRQSTRPGVVRPVLDRVDAVPAAAPRPSVG
jgi:hypothetical protein